MDKVEKLQQYPKLIQKLDTWILIPDRNLIPHLRELADVMKGIYKFDKELVLFRGFDVKSVQDNMGLTTMPHVGQQVPFKTSDRALSFSKEIGIAKSFGGIILASKFKTDQTDFLDVTPELVYLVHQERKLSDYKTQHEVIILPPSEFQSTVVQAQRSPMSWLEW
jgi:hypothetical protein